MRISRPCWTFWIVALLSRGLLLAFCLTSRIGLMPDEAQYWTWSQHLALGYYSKPPGIAWQIALGTLFFGQTEFGVRFVSLLLPIASALLLRWLVSLCGGSDRAAWLSAIAFLISPMGLIGSLFATTDGCLVFFWLLGLCLYLDRVDRSSRWFFVGLAIACGALWKWMIFLLWVPLGIYDVLRRRFDPRMLLGMFLSLIGLIPPFVWNLSNDWPTFRHAGAALLGAHEHLSGNPIAFFFAGVALVSPGFFLMALPSLFTQEKIEKKTNLLRIAVAIVWGGLLLFACHRKAQGNWAVVAQAMMLGLLGMSLTVRPRWGRALFVGACVLSVGLQGILFVAPYVGGVFLKKNPMKQGMGCEEIASCLERVGYGPQDFLCSERYQTVSQLWFYGPQKRKTYFLNIQHLRNNQFCFWPGMPEECVDKNGFFVSIVPAADASSHHAKKLRRELLPYFQYVSAPRYEWLRMRSTPVRCMIFMRVEGYKGTVPSAVDKY